MTRYLNSHRWFAGAVVMALVLALVATACGSSSAKRSQDTKPQAGQAAGVTGAPPQDPAQIKSTNAAGAAPEAGAAPATGDLAAQRDAAPSTGSTTGGSGAPSPLPSTLDRKIIQTATLELTTDEVSKRFEDVGNIAVAAGGFIASSSFGNAGDKQTASITIRVPGDNYQRALNDLRKLGDVKGEQSGANDVTEQFTDLQSRLRNLQATEAQYLTFLQRATGLNDVLTVQDRLNQVRADIEQVQGRIDLVQHQTDLATITVHLDPPVVAATAPKTHTGSGPLDVAADSFRASLAVLLGIATVALAVAAFSWWIVPLAIAGGLIARRQARPSVERGAAPPPATPTA